MRPRRARDQFRSKPHQLHLHRDITLLVSLPSRFSTLQKLPLTLLLRHIRKLSRGLLNLDATTGFQQLTPSALVLIKILATSSGVCTPHALPPTIRPKYPSDHSPNSTTLGISSFARHNFIYRVRIISPNTLTAHTRKLRHHAFKSFPPVSSFQNHPGRNPEWETRCP